MHFPQKCVFCVDTVVFLPFNFLSFLSINSTKGKAQNALDPRKNVTYRSRLA